MVKFIRLGQRLMSLIFGYFFLAGIITLNLVMALVAGPLAYYFHIKARKDPILFRKREDS